MSSERQHNTVSLLRPLSAVQELFAARNLLWQIVKRNVHVRYKGSALGLFWMFATPLFMITVYTFVFSVVFKARWGADVGGSKVAFAMIIFCGLAVYNVFAESVSGAAGVITGNVNFVKKVIFPLEILPFATVVASLVFGLVWLLILFLGLAVLMQKVCVTAICLPLVLIPLVFLSSGFGWFVASLAVFFRDVGHAVGIALQVMFFMTPIFYALEMVPEPYRTVLRVNPLTTIVQNIRRVMIFGQWPEWSYLGAITLLSLLVFQCGYFWFQKTKRGFADVL